jgi:hypothetical protein
MYGAHCRLPERDGGVDIDGRDSEADRGTRSVQVAWRNVLMCDQIDFTVGTTGSMREAAARTSA